MDIQSTLTIIKTYPFADIDSEGITIRKHIATSDLTPDLVRSYLVQYRKITLVPKRMMGTSPIRNTQEAISLDAASLQPVSLHGLNGFDGVPAQSSGGSAELYRIMYENAKEEAREYKRKYEDAVSDKHRAELELASNKNSVVGDIAQGLAGFAPMLMGGMGGSSAVGVGEVPKPQPQPNTKPVSDIKLQAIVKYYAGLDSTNKQKVYDLLAKVFSDLTLIDKMMIVE